MDKQKISERARFLATAGRFRALAADLKTEGFDQTEIMTGMMIALQSLPVTAALESRPALVEKVKRIGRLVRDLYGLKAD